MEARSVDGCWRRGPKSHLAYNSAVDSDTTRWPIRRSTRSNFVRIKLTAVNRIASVDSACAYLLQPLDKTKPPRQVRSRNIIRIRPAHTRFKRQRHFPAGANSLRRYLPGGLTEGAGIAI